MEIYAKGKLLPWKHPRMPSEWKREKVGGEFRKLDGPERERKQIDPKRLGSRRCALMKSMCPGGVLTVRFLETPNFISRQFRKSFLQFRGWAAGEG